jgi:hypothetical protein
MAGGTVVVPQAANGQAAAFQFGAGSPAGITLTSSASINVPASAPGPSSIKRATQDVAGAVPFYYVTFNVSVALSAAVIAAETVTLTNSDPPTASYFAEIDDITASPGTKLASAGPGTVAGSVATIQNGTATAGRTLQPGHTYLLQFYYVPASNASPTPTTTAPTSSSQACANQTTTGTNATASQKLVTAGGAVCLPLFATYGGSIVYPTVSAQITATLTSSTTNLGAYPALSTGTPIFYLQITLSGATNFGTGSTAGGGLTSPSIIAGQTYSVFAQVMIFGIASNLTPCQAMATAGTGGGVIAGLGTVLKGVSIPAATTGLVEIYPGATAGAGAC